VPLLRHNRRFKRIGVVTGMNGDGGAASVSVLSTDAMPPRLRAEYWHESVLRRLDAKHRKDNKKPFQARRGALRA
jgi:hypothetical protein